MARKRQEGPADSSTAQTRNSAGSSLLWAGTLYKRSRRSVPTPTQKLTLWRLWKPFHVQLFQDGEMKMWALKIKEYTEDTDSAKDTAHYAAKKPSRLERVVLWRPLDYREQLINRAPFCLSIIPRSQTIYLMRTITSDKQKQLCEALTTTMASPEDEAPIVSLLRRSWKLTDKDDSGTLNFDEFLLLMMNLNIFWPVDKAKAAFNKFDDEKDGELHFHQFVRLYAHVCVPPLLSKMVKSLGSEGELLSENDLLKFLHTVQGDDHLTQPEVHRIAQTLMLDHNQSVPLKLNDFAVSCLLFHQNNSLLHPYFKTLREEEMKRPITNYWISTSHNTYLTGDQLLSDSSSHMYRLVLHNGVRCVELDCWDGPKGKPIIYHGHTLTSRITFEEVIKVCAESAFDYSPFPVILSLENHCSLKQQDAMADILQKYMGNMLLLPPKTPDAVAPSPWDLRGKIILKGKRHTSTADADDDDDEDEVDLDILSKAAKKDKSKAAKLKKLKPTKTFKEKAKKQSVSDKLSSLIWMNAGNKKELGEIWKNGVWRTDEMTPSMVTSWGEDKLKNLVSKSSAHTTVAVMKTHQFCFTRTYPMGTRVDSSNFNPMADWALGAQLVALNFQTLDQSVRLNQALFNNGDRCGYVLKPTSRLANRPFIPAQQQKKYSHYHWTLNLQVIMGHKIPRAQREAEGSIVDPYIKVYLAGTGLKGSQASQSFQTASVPDNGFNPTYGDKFTFESFDPEVEMLVVEVWDANIGTVGIGGVGIGAGGVSIGGVNIGTGAALGPQLIGYFAARVVELREGIRICPLHGKGGIPMIEVGAEHNIPGVLVSLSIDKPPVPSARGEQ